MAQVSVTINEKLYRMACDDGQEDHLRSLAGEIDQAIKGLRQSVGEIGDQRLTVMAAITIADKREELQREISQLKAQIEGLKAASEAAMAERGSLDEGIARAIESAAARIEAAARQLKG